MRTWNTTPIPSRLRLSYWLYECANIGIEFFMKSHFFFSCSIDVNAYKFICKLQKGFKSNALLVVVVWNGSGNDCSPITDGKWKKATRKMFQKKKAQISLLYLKDCCGHESISLKIGRIGFTKSSLFNIKYNPVSFWTLLMFCLLNLQTNACEPNPKTTSSDF